MLAVHRVVAPVRRWAPRSGRLTSRERAHLDALTREVVMLRAGARLVVEPGRRRWVGRCQWCKMNRPLQVSHVEPKGRCPHLQFDPDNCTALCIRCHLYRWHKGGSEPERWLVGLIGQDARDRLAWRAATRGKAADYHATRLHLQGLVMVLRARRGNDGTVAG